MADDDRFIRELYKQYLFFSMLAILGSALGQIASAIIIGNRLGAGELSVIGLTLPIYYVFATAGALLGVGGTAVCARLIGKDRHQESRRAFTAVYLMILMAAVALCVVMLLFLDQIVAMLGVENGTELFDKVKNYAHILTIGGVFIMSIYPAFNLLRLDGRVASTVAVFFVMAAATILLDIVLLFVFHMDVAGVAIATVAGAGAAGVFGAVLLFTRSKNFRLSGFRKAARQEDERSFAGLALDIVKSGSPSALENLCILIRTLALNWMIVNILKDMAGLAAFKVTDSLNSFALVFIAGVSGSLIPFVGVFDAERDTKSISQLLKLAFRWGCGMVTVFAAICLVFAEQAAGIFGMSGAEELAAAAPAIRIFALSLLPATANNILICLYQASDKTAPANIMTLGRSLAWVLLASAVLSARLGITGIWHSFWIAELLTLLFAVLYSLVYRRKNKYLSRLFLLDTEAESLGAYKSFSVKNTEASIAGSAAGIGEFCELNKLSSKRAMSISLAIEEMLMSIRQHCLPDDSELSMNVRLLIFRDIVILRIRNGGKEFNPIEYYERMRALAQNSDGHVTGLDGFEMLSDSIGVKMILDLADVVDYRSTFGVNNLTIIL